MKKMILLIVVGIAITVACTALGLYLEKDGYAVYACTSNGYDDVTWDGDSPYCVKYGIEPKIVRLRTGGR
jgi:hypothetical protein